MKKRQRPDLMENITPNLIPMIDIMFLLLLFFMLGADMSQREHVDLVLPIADRLKEDDNKVVLDGLTTVNVHHSPDNNAACALHDNGGICREVGHWKWAISGRNYNRDQIKDQLKILAEVNLEPDVDPLAHKRLSSRKVLIRADSAAPYGDIQKIIEYAGTAGIYKIEVGGAKPPKEK